MPRHPPIALKTLDRSHCQYPSRDPEGIVVQAKPLTRLAKRDPKDRRISAIPKGLSPRTRSCAGPASMELAQKDQLLEIGSRARLGKPIICKGLSVPCDKSWPFRIMKFEQIFSLRCQTEQAQSTRLGANSYANDFISPSLLDTNAAILADCAFTTILRIACWWSRTGSNRRHPACKAGALPAELRPLIVSPIR